MMLCNVTKNKNKHNEQKHLDTVAFLFHNSHDVCFVPFQIDSLFKSTIRVEVAVMNPAMVEEERQPLKKQKKKHRGNRQLQRYRAKLRKQGLNDASIKQLLPNETDLEMDQEQQEKEMIADHLRETLVDQVG